MSQIFCNWFEDDSMYAGTNILATDNISYYMTSSVDITGNPASFISIAETAWDFCAKLFFFDYSIFYDYDAATATKTANFLSFFRFLLAAIGVIMWIDLAITTRRLIFG